MMDNSRMVVKVLCSTRDIANTLIHFIPCYAGWCIDFIGRCPEVTVKDLMERDFEQFKKNIQSRVHGASIIEYTNFSLDQNKKQTPLEKALEFLDNVKTTLQEKNKAYGDSAANPLRIFSKSDSDEAIKVRIDDKLSRIAKGDGSGNEDAIKDLVGYLALLAGMRK